MDTKKLDAIIRKEVDAAVAQAYSQGYIAGFFDCLAEKNKLLAEHKFKSEKVEGLRQ